MKFNFQFTCSIFVAFISFAVWGYAQPTLPDIAGVCKKGVVCLEWKCQFDGVASVSVLRSADSAFNYNTIGTIKRTAKGIQRFTDSNCLSGNNYYKVSVVFQSGLRWNCHYYGIYVNKGNHQAVKVTSPNNLSANTTTYPTPLSIQQVKDNNEWSIAKLVAGKDSNLCHTLRLSFADDDDMNGYMDDLPEQKNKKINAQQSDDDEEPDNGSSHYTLRLDKPQKQLDMLFDNFGGLYDYLSNMSAYDRKKYHVSLPCTVIEKPAIVEKEVVPVLDTIPPPPPLPKITFTLHEENVPSENTIDAVTSRVIYIDKRTGHIAITVPADYEEITYSVFFFDDKGNVALEIPHLHSKKAGLDPRNFQKKGVYKFILYRSGLTFESGFVDLK
ncbi:MAG: hypothetical protein EBX41_05555 [Chitinophagia bacterium]|nr:hypothetical protein [Chitinophagia bacterium]